MVIGWGCITPSKYEQSAVLLRQGYSVPTPAVTSPETETVLQGQYNVPRHPITGEPLRDWEPVTEITTPDDPMTPEDETGVKIATFPCEARAIITGGLNVQGTTERWTSKGNYENVDFVQLKCPPNILITKRDRVTNITDSSGNIVWKEEEMGSFKPTVFDVQGVSPVLDPFGSLVEYVVMLARSEVQGGVENRGETT